MNCKTCGAPLSSMTCKYCGTDNSLTEADCKDYLVKMDFDGAKRLFYIGKVEIDTVYSDDGRTEDGRIITPHVYGKRKLTLIEL